MGKSIMNILCKIGIHKESLKYCKSGKVTYISRKNDKCERCGCVLGGKG